MSEITLEKIDIIRERTNVTYTEAKEALEATEGNVVDALIYIEENKKNTIDEIATSKEEFIAWLKDLIRKGNVSRIKVRKGEKVLLDVPVNAGVAAGLMTMVFPPALAVLFLTAVVAKVTVEITKADGSVEVVNRVIREKAEDVKEKVKDLKTNISEKVDIKMPHKNSEKDEDTVYQYTVKFDDAKDDDKGDDKGEK